MIESTRDANSFFRIFLKQLLYQIKWLLTTLESLLKLRVDNLRIYDHLFEFLLVGVVVGEKVCQQLKKYDT